MGMGWHFFSFEKQKWNAIFGSADANAERHLVASVIWDKMDFDEGEQNLPDPESDPDGYLDVLYLAAPASVKNIMKKVCEEGISYDGLSKEDAALLDNAIVGFFCPEGLETLLQFEYESPDFVHMSLIAEMLKMTDISGNGSVFSRIFKKEQSFQPRLLPIMQTGRRLANGGRPDANGDGLYFVLSPDETNELREEVETILNSKPMWKHPDFEDGIREYLLSPLKNIETKGKWLAARWC